MTWESAIIEACHPEWSEAKCENRNEVKLNEARHPDYVRPLTELIEARHPEWSEAKCENRNEVELNEVNLEHLYCRLFSLVFQ
jgi:hypothetical protein